mgnify:CR=1 FL=1
MAGIRVLTFDCDGVLFDTEAANKAFYNRILAYFNRPPMSEEQFAHAQMHTVDAAIANLFPDPAEYEKAQQYRKEIGYTPFIPYMQMDPHLVGLLEKCRGRLHLAVATNRSDTMGKVLEIHGIAHYFDLVVTALDVKRPKPDPEQLRRVLAHFKIRPEAMLYVGDSLLDARAAEAAGVWFAACRNPELSGHFHIERLSELESILSAIPFSGTSVQGDESGQGL